MQKSVLFLGSGSSAGIPVIGCDCSVCQSNNPKNRRLRSSVLLKIGKKNFLIDAGPDFRQQALVHQIKSLDGLLLTHTHFDHVGGIDELRVFYCANRYVLPVLASSATLTTLQKRYDYLFVEKSEGVSLTAQLQFHMLVEERGHTTFCGIPIQYMSYEQGGSQVTGFRFGNFAYLTDVKNFPETLFHDLVGVETLILNALRESPSYMHLSVKEAIAFSKRVGARRTYLTHIAHEMDHAVEQSLPHGFAFAYDGLELPL